MKILDEIKKFFGEGNIYVYGIAKRSNGKYYEFKAKQAYIGDPNTTSKDEIERKVIAEMKYKLNAEVTKIDKIDII
jgi:hypothetical protein